jgi:glucokinase
MTMAQNHHVPTGQIRNAIGLDIGGTKTAAAVVTGSGQILSHDVTATPGNNKDQNVQELLLEMIQDLRQQYPHVEAIGVGAAGIVEWPRGYIRWAPNNTYQDLPLREIIEDRTQLPTIVDNDANAAAWAEAQLGRAASYRDMIFLTVGTGVGSGIVLNGQLYRGRTGLAAELGHIIVDPQGPQCGCGNRGCLEALASGTALERFGREVSFGHPDSPLAQLATDKGRLSGKTIRDAARQGDQLAKYLFERLGHWLGIGIASLLNVFEVDAVIIGGGLVEAGDLFLGSTRSSAEIHVFAPRHRPVPPILAGSFGSDAGVIGAAHLALTYAPTPSPEIQPVAPSTPQG